ncbi:ectoine/hydroxyectoine ABC transporter permease subunit EhuC [Paracoccus sp. P2]|uniref:ectoine/hydroxyectoine ABC transporter permease subunit EhuC n=1 Tax=Paracoccus TaxID=265 RepID=UPI00048CE0B3|nr:ectoine/hydroxyectoine ABC transporter permease subunit EhuC [Paracoccus pantotrophus]MDF3856595.1 ectoine/hydroxyectoine ABC transporter permease subunit EhuC [Paracoccus pantotrophus]RDD93208.1 ectoine/hydroxyectoine ABC transporter permease subunit EhuC [Paracoccus pantotrophus]WGR65026.1 ectoine/hydroxyectoine ABC transporter permease subunit EhuC [Paracoccus pantotrophus]SFP26047.1 polar amino acid transport system permease protein [Paracoccus pantotrophus]
MSYLEFLGNYSDRLIDGSLITLLQFVLAALVAVAAAIISGLIKLAQLKPLQAVATVYIEIFRGTSLLVQLYWFFFVLPLLGVSLEKFVAGFLAVGLCYGAYGAELVRGAIQSVPRGQWEAALALNMSPAQRMWRIILPQALVIMLPPWGNLMVEILKGTALVALISVPDLMFETRQINNNTYLSAQAFGTALVIYYIFARFVVTPLMRWLERVMARRIGRA